MASAVGRLRRRSVYASAVGRARNRGVEAEQWFCFAARGRRGRLPRRRSGGRGAGWRTALAVGRAIGLETVETEQRSASWRRDGAGVGGRRPPRAGDRGAGWRTASAV